jgi:hypothetical protein
MRPGFINSFTPSRDATPPFVELFDYPSWPGTIADPTYWVGFVFDVPFVETFEFSGGWPGTIADPTYWVGFVFDVPFVETFEVGWP